MMQKRPHITNFVYNLPIGLAQRKTFLTEWFDTAKDLYQKNLYGHFKCINALEFSGEGDLLFSGGDDFNILMWHVDTELKKNECQLRTAREMPGKHESNVFAIGVDSWHKRVISGGGDFQVIIHDYSRLQTASNYQIRAPINGISIYPKNVDVFVMANKVGLFLYDQRVPNKVRGQFGPILVEHNCAAYNPKDENILASAGSLGTCLWDARNPKSELCILDNSQAMDVKWNTWGDRLLSLRNSSLPILFDVRKQECKVELNSMTHCVSCTSKSACFAGEFDQYVLSGSDDFNIHMWKVPENLSDSKKILHGPKMILRGHRSIVNQVRFSRSRQVVASSGIENIIKLWSPFQMRDAKGDRDTPCQEKSRRWCSSYSCSLLLRRDSLERNEMQEDEGMLHFFDELLRREYTTSQILSTRLLYLKRYALLQVLKPTRFDFCTLRNSTVRSNPNDDTLEYISVSGDSESDTSPYATVYPDESSTELEPEPAPSVSSSEGDDEEHRVVRRHVGRKERFYRQRMRRRSNSSSSNGS